jgi:hypothetical protein
VKGYWADWVIGAAFVGAACATIYAAMARAMRRAVADKQRETERQLSAMATTVKALQARVAELGGLNPIPAQLVESATTSNATEIASGQKSKSLQPETVAVLTAAATTFLGRKAQIRAAQAAPAEHSSAGAWAQQGRAFVQTSHNPRSRG